MSGSLDNLSAPRLVEDWMLPRGRMYLLGDLILVHPSTGMALRHGGRPPFWTRHMLGVREAERDKRKKAKRATKVTPSKHVIDNGN